jgi:hypothetical protein
MNLKKVCIVEENFKPVIFPFRITRADTQVRPYNATVHP